MSLVHIRLTQHDATTGADVGVSGAVRAVPTVDPANPSGPTIDPA